MGTRTVLFAAALGRAALTLPALAFISCGSSPPDDIIQKSGQPALVFVKENSQANDRSVARPWMSSFRFARARIARS